jgi:Putative prokaryotic signal transducing protein
LKRVFRAASLLQVAHARNVLIAAGIDSELRNQYLAGALGDLPMLETWPQLWVEDALESAALRALEKAAAAPSGALGSARSAASNSNPSSRPAGAAVRHFRVHSLCQS